MKVYARPRQGGKTTELVRLAAQEFLYVVCPDRAQALHVQRVARDMGLDIPFPMTWGEFLRCDYHSKGVRGFVIDNLDLCIQGMSHVPVRAVSLTDEDAPVPAVTPAAPVQAPPG
jgi:hypothetical protein